jgi:(S)-sulfolactate dehydrogenase
MLVIICEFMDEASVDALRRRFDVRYDPTLVERRAELLALLAGAEALLVRNRTQVDVELLAAAPALRVVGRLGVGLDNIAVDACAARGVAVIPASGANALAVAEYVIATTMLLLRGAYSDNAAMGAGLWPRPRLSAGRETGGKTLGLVGFGAIGRLTARLAQGLGMHVIAHDPMLAAHAPVWHETGVNCSSLEALLGAARTADRRYARPDGRAPAGVDEARRSIDQHRARRHRRPGRAGRGPAHRPPGGRRTRRL